MAPVRLALGVGLAAGAALLLWTLLSGGGEPGAPAAGGPLATGGSAAPPAEAGATGEAPPLARAEPPPGARLDPTGGPRGLSGPSSAELADLLEATRLEARRWLDARRAAKGADDRGAEEEARARWDEARRALLAAVREDAESAAALLRALAEMEDEEEEFALARLLPFVFADGFEAHLVATLTSAGPVRARRLALVALRGRGLPAADATLRVAAQESDALLRAEATDELGAHLADPVVRPLTGRIHEVLSARLGDEDAGARRAALRALLAARQPPADPGQREAVGRIARADPDAELRRLAEALDRRWAEAGVR
jgi:hypothetical protein